MLNITGTINDIGVIIVDTKVIFSLGNPFYNNITPADDSTGAKPVRQKSNKHRYLNKLGLVKKPFRDTIKLVRLYY